MVNNLAFYGAGQTGNASQSRKWIPFGGPIEFKNGKRVSNEIKKESLKIDNTVLDATEEKQLLWFGRVP